jgi:hypothetical protein
MSDITPSQAPASAPDPAGSQAPGVPEPWIERALAAERRAEELSARQQQLQSTLDEARQALAATQRHHQIERQLIEQGAIDLEAAILLADAELGAGNDIPAAIASLKRRKPYLFRVPAARRASAMSGEAPPPPALDHAAQEARHSGDRRALLRYLRLRRGG